MMVPCAQTFKSLPPAAEARRLYRTQEGRMRTGDGRTILSTQDSGDWTLFG